MTKAYDELAKLLKEKKKLKPEDIEKAEWTKDEYDIKFNFKFGWSDYKMKPYTYTGTAKGDPTKGSLSGAVNDGNEKKLRTFTFEGKTVDGTFTADHKETTKGREGETGTMKLTVEK